MRYADDANVYVRSQKAEQRVMALLRRLYEKQMTSAKRFFAHYLTLNTLRSRSHVI